MGSFNVACSLSNISISSGDEIVFFPLELSRFPENIAHGNIYLIYSHCFYYPAAFPLKGIYDDYGGIEDIEKDEAFYFNTAWYNKDPGDVNHFNEMWDSREDECPKNIKSGMFVHADIYNMLIDTAIGEFGETVNYDKLKDMFDQIVVALKEAKDKYAELDMPSEMDPYDFCLPNDLNYSGLKFRKYDTFTKMVKRCFEMNEMKDRIIEMYKFESAMYAINAFYFPAMNGYQCGNHYMSKKLYDKASEIVAKKIERYN